MTKREQTSWTIARTEIIGIVAGFAAALVFLFWGPLIVAWVLGRL